MPLARSAFPELITCLSPNRVKLGVYNGDAEFARALDVFRGRWGTNASFRERLWNSACLLFKPDAVIGCRLRSVFKTLRHHGLMPVAVRVLYVSSMQASLLWRYQANVSTAERLRLIKAIMTAGPSLYVMLRDLTSRTSAPATVHVTHLKGPTIASRRKSWHIRSLVGPAISNVLSYVHASDDPADLVRELGILFGKQEQAEMLAEIDAKQDRTDEALNFIATLESNIPRDLLRGDIGRTETFIEPPGSFGSTKHALWKRIVRDSVACRSFVTGESYNTRDATVPDDKRLSLPLDFHLLFDE